MRYTYKQFDRSNRAEIIPELEKIALAGDYTQSDLNKMPQIFVAYFKKKAVAFSCLACYHGSWCLRLCVVDPSHRGNGLQRKLIRKRLAYLKNRGARWANVWVYPGNEYSLHNIIDEGFTRVSDKPRMFNDLPHYKYRHTL